MIKYRNAFSKLWNYRHLDYLFLNRYLLLRNMFVQITSRHLPSLPGSRNTFSLYFGSQIGHRIQIRLNGLCSFAFKVRIYHNRFCRSVSYSSVLSISLSCHHSYIFILLSLIVCNMPSRLN